MAFALPIFTAPDFSEPRFSQCPLAAFEKVRQNSVAPDNYHATSIYPEYFHLSNGNWQLIKQSRMDCVAVLRENGLLEATEFRHLRRGDCVAVGRQENGEEGIYVHTTGF